MTQSHFYVNQVEFEMTQSQFYVKHTEFKVTQSDIHSKHTDFYQSISCLYVINNYWLTILNDMSYDIPCKLKYM
jgi:hypothetical protein